MTQDVARPIEKVANEGARCIAICTVGELFGGVERHVLGMLSSLQVRGIEAMLILFNDAEMAAQARSHGVKPIILPNRNRSMLATSRDLAGILKQRNVHVVHVHGYKATVFCALARRWFPFAVVKTVHGLAEPMAHGLIHTWRNRLYYFIDSAATRLAHATVCYVTSDLRNCYSRAHSGLRTSIVPNGVGIMNRRDFPRPPEMRSDCCNLLIVGRLDKVKGHHLAIEAIATRYQSGDTHLYIAGVGPRETELRTLAESRGIAAKVHMLGFRRNVYSYIAHCNALLMPSLHEGLPYTLLEAMALGTPVIASRVGGLAEVVRDQVTGLLVPPRDAAALADAIHQLIADPGLCTRLGDQAQRLQRELYSLDAMTERYLEVYQQALLANV